MVHAIIIVPPNVQVGIWMAVHHVIVIIIMNIDNANTIYSTYDQYLKE